MPRVRLEAIAAADQTWLHMDRPNNLMHVHSVFALEGEPDWDEYLELHIERQVSRYRVFRQRPVRRGRRWYWEDDPEFDLRRHVLRTELPGPSGVAELRAYIGERFSEQFDFNHPLWTAELITGIHGLGDGPCSVSLQRYHHALADGIRLVQLGVGMMDFGGLSRELAVPGRVGRGGQRRGLVGQGVALGRRVASDTVDIARHLAGTTVRLPMTLLRGARPSTIGVGLDLAIHPSRMIDVFEHTLGSESNEAVNTLAELARLLAAGREVRATWSGKPGVAKGVTWVDDLDLARIKEIGRAHGGTVNDTLLAIISRALSRYLGVRGDRVREIHWMTPVSLQPVDAELPKVLGNHFSLVFVPMPLGIEDYDTLIAAIRARMTRLKNSAEPVVTFGVQRVIAETPRAVSVAITNLFANKTVGVLTNVPGPTLPMTYAGAPVQSVLGFVPTSGDEPLGLCICSYDGRVSIGIAADAKRIPDPEEIADLINEEYQSLAGDR